MLCTPAPPCRELQEEEMWAQQPAKAKEEDQVDILQRNATFYTETGCFA